MTMTTIEQPTENPDGVFDAIREARDALSVKRAFGDSYEVGDVTIIPVARVGGGAGGGGGEGEAADDEKPTGSGFGTGFGMGASPVGVYEVRDGTVTWKPSVDVNRVIRGGQILAGIIAICATIIVWRKS